MQILRNMFAPKFHVSPRVFRLLEDIARVREGLRLSLNKVPWVPSLMRDAMARAAWGSTATEGCTLSLEAVKGLMEGRGARGYPEKHVRMATNYLEALAWLQALYIKALQRVQVEGKDLGEWMEFIAEAILETLKRVQGSVKGFAVCLKVIDNMSVITYTTLNGTICKTVNGA